MLRLEVEKVVTLSGHRDSIYALAEGSDNKFYSSGADGMIVEWNYPFSTDGILIAKVPNSVYVITLVQQKGLLLFGQNFEGVHMIDVRSKKETASAAITDSAIFDIKVIGSRVLTACGDGTLVIQNLSDLSVITKFRASEKSARIIAVHPSGKEFAVGYSDHKIRIFNGENFKMLYQYEAHKNSVFALDYTPDGNWLLSGSRDAHLKIWSRKEEYVLRQSIVAHMYAINHLAFSPDHRFFATCSMDKSIKVWSLEEFRLLKVIDKARHAGHGTSVNKVFWKNNSQLISCSDDRTISVWNIKSSIN